MSTDKGLKPVVPNGLPFDPYNAFASEEAVTVFIAQPTPRNKAGVWISFKRNLSFGESTDLDTALFLGMTQADKAKAAQADGGDAIESIFRVDIGKQKRWKLARYIADWNLPGPDGKTIPWPHEPADRLGVIAQLSEAAGDWLVGEVDKLIAEAKKVETAEADPDGNPTSGPGLELVAASS